MPPIGWLGNIERWKLNWPFVDPVSTLSMPVGIDMIVPIMTSRVGERGQITIEKAIREELAIYAGDETVQRVEDGRILIEVVPGRHRRSLAGSLGRKAGRVPPDESWEALRAAAWATPDRDRLAADVPDEPIR